MKRFTLYQWNSEDDDAVDKAIEVAEGLYGPTTEHNTFTDMVEEMDLILVTKARMDVAFPGVWERLDDLGDYLSETDVVLVACDWGRDMFYAVNDPCGLIDRDVKEERVIEDSGETYDTQKWDLFW